MKAKCAFFLGLIIAGGTFINTQAEFYLIAGLIMTVIGLFGLLLEAIKE